MKHNFGYSNVGESSCFHVAIAMWIYYVVIFAISAVLFFFPLLLVDRSGSIKVYV